MVLPYPLASQPRPAEGRQLPVRIEPGAFPYYGGSLRIVNTLLPHLPPHTKRLIEPFCGPAVFSLNAPWIPLRVLNDRYGDVIHLLRTIREQPAELAYALSLTPYHRLEFTAALQPIPLGIDDIERARRIFVRFSMARAGGGRLLVPSDWSRSLTEERRGMAGAVSRFRSRVARFDSLAARLATVQFEAVDFEELAVYDHTQAFWFLDPPWEPVTRSPGNGHKYAFEFTADDYERLARFAHRLRGPVLVLGYDGGCLARHFANWRRTTFDVVLSAGAGRGQRQVVGWLKGM